MADGRHLEKLKNVHNPATVWPIDLKFGTDDAYSPSWPLVLLEFWHFKNPRWRTAVIFKTVKSATVRPVATKFGNDNAFFYSEAHRKMKLTEVQTAEKEIRRTFGLSDANNQLRTSSNWRRGKKLISHFGLELKILPFLHMHADKAIKTVRKWYISIDK